MDLINAQILLNLDYYDIINACHALLEFSRVCDTPYFWALKADYDFNIPRNELLLVPGNSNQERYKFIYDIKNPNKGLIEAAKLGILSLVKYFLKQGADIHAGNNDALKSAAEYGHLDVVKYLVEQGADLHANNDEALRLADEHNHPEVVRYLINQGANTRVLNEERPETTGQKVKSSLYKGIKKLPPY